MCFQPMSAQDLKPVKDKELKLFGYQDASKNWVINPSFDKAKKFDQGVAVVTVKGLDGVIDTEGYYVFEPEYTEIPSFDKNGLSVAFVKENRQKTYAVLNTAGKVVLPLECVTVKIDNKNSLILAERFFEVENPEMYNDPYACAWGVYDFEGNEIFAPQFDARPSFNGDGVASAKDRGSLLEGVIDTKGNVLLPFDYFYAFKSGKGFRALDPSMQVVNISADGRSATVDNLAPNAPWLPIPYDTGNDVVRAFAYRRNMIGVPIHKNAFWEASLQVDASGTRAQMMTSPAVAPSSREIEWGHGYSNFARLELAKDEDNGTFKYDRTGDVYTIQLNLYDYSGRFIENLSNWGKFVGLCDEGVFYNAEDGRTYFIAYDVNWPNDPAAITLSHYHTVDASYLAEVLGMPQDVYNSMTDYWQSKRIFTDVDLAEKSGYQSYVPFSGPMPFSDGAKLISMLENKYPFLHRKYYAENVYTVTKSTTKDDLTTLHVEPGYIARYHDDYGNSFVLNVEEPVFWGVRRDRYIRIMLDPFSISAAQKATPAKVPGVVCDINDKDMAVRFVFGLFEEDGTFIRIVGSATKLNFIGRDLFGFSEAGLLFSRRRPEYGVIKYRELGPYTDLTSEFGAVDF